VRVREALETGAEILAVACPICKCMLEDALTDEGLEGKIEVKDLAEIVLDAMKGR
jgi:Fe-S oxidoreductase